MRLSIRGWSGLIMAHTRAGAVAAVFAALAGSAVCAETTMTPAPANGVAIFSPSKAYDEAKRLMAADEFQRAKFVLQDALAESKETGDNYFAFFFARDLSRCEEKAGHLLDSIGYAQEALELLDKTGGRMSEQTQVFERLLLEGLLSARHFDNHQITLARQWHRRANGTLQTFIEKKTGKPYDLKSGVVPDGIAQNFVLQIGRQLWHESRILEREARTAEALACLDAAGRILFVRNGARKRDRVGEDYYWKTQNMRAMLLSFLGFVPEAIEIERQCSEQEPARDRELSIQTARLNMSRNLSQYHGPSETFLTNALDACMMIEKTGGFSAGNDARRLVEKMVFDLTRDSSATQYLAAVEAAFKNAGWQMKADYTERDRIAMEINSGAGVNAETEAALRRMLESFRDNGNRGGEPTLFGYYGDFCAKSGRHEDALYLYTRAYELSKQYGWHVHLPRIMGKLTLTCLALEDAAGARQWCENIRALLGARRDFPPHRRVEALVMLSEMLSAFGCEDDARAAQEEAESCAKTSNVPDIWLRKHYSEKLAAYKKTTDSTSPAETEAKADSTPGAGSAPAPDSASSPSSSPSPDLQPRRVVSEARPGETALARLTLANPSSNTHAGNLVYPPSALLTKQDMEAGEIHIAINADASAEEEEKEEKAKEENILALELAPSEILRIYLEAPISGPDADETAEIRWVPQNAPSQKTEWNYRATREEADITVVNANLADMNPFYYVPLYHVIRKRDAAAAQVFDFSVTCDTPCHVEIADAASGEVIAVDRQGDGAFDKEGDLLFDDANGNLFPDHAFAEDETQFAIEIRVYPVSGAGSASPGEITVTVAGAFDGQWQELAKSIFKKTPLADEE